MSDSTEASALLPQRPRDPAVRGAIGFLNPTRSRSYIGPTNSSESRRDGGIEQSSARDAIFEWRSRDNRKGRHVLILPQSWKNGTEPALSRSWKSVGRGIWRMLTVYAWWDVSWIIAMLFTVGCMLFTCTGFFHWLPLAAPGTKFRGENAAGGWAACIGATLFAIAGVLLVVEATNENQTECFGWAVEETYDDMRPSADADVDTDGHSSAKQSNSARVQHLVPCNCRHHQHALSGGHFIQHLHEQHPNAGRTWEWWPTWRELRSHYIYDTGFLASSILAIGTIIFWVTGIMSIPQIQDKASHLTLYWTYWLTYLVGGLFFVASSILYILETQTSWYVPNPYSIGWWVGFFNLIGSVGWTLSASLGYCEESWCQFQSNLTLLWASLAFLTGSLLLWYEALEKYPVERQHVDRSAV